MLHLFAVFGHLISLQYCSPASSAANGSTLTAGQALIGSSDKLLSSNGKFALGFFQTGSSKSSSDTTTLPNWYLGIWFNKIPKFTPVWIANRAKPITDPNFRLSKLTVSRDGNLVILNHATKSIIWSSQIVNRTKANRNTTVVLSDIGNLVILDASNPSNVWWQSFEHPTDVFLPGAKIGRNKGTGQEYSLVSKKNLIDPAPGLYCLELDPTGARQFFVKICNSSMVYFSTGEWNGQYFNSVPEMSIKSFLSFKFIDNDEEEYFTYTPLDPTVITLYTLDVSGFAKLLLWAENLQDWQTIYTQPNAPCDVFAVCGPFIVCNDNTLPLCNCMKGFCVKSTSDWELDDRREGCIRNTPLDCISNKSTTGLTDQFFPIPSVRLPYDGHSMEDVASAHECQQVCLRNCSCTAYSYGKSGCSIWNGELINVKQYNGTINTDREILYLRFAAEEVQSWGNSSSRRRTIIGVAVGASISAFGFMALVLLLIIWRNTRKWRCCHPVNKDGGGIITFRYVEVVLVLCSRGF